MKPPNPSWRAGRAAFSTVEIVAAVLMCSAATAGVLYVGKSMAEHQTAIATTNQQNAYATFQAQVALQGINPSLVANPLAAVINQGAVGSGAVPVGGENMQAAFEGGAVTQPAGAQRSLSGSAQVDALNYTVAAAGNEGTRGAGIGFAIETAGPAPAAAANAVALAPPAFNVSGDLTNAAFPLNDIATLPTSNPAGTVYRYTTDGTTPTSSSPVWVNDPDWTPASFPAEVTLAAFSPDPQYSQSPSVTATYSMQLGVSFSRADGRADLYDFYLADLSDPAATGIVLTSNVAGETILYTLDGSDPSTSPTATAYSGAFAPSAAQFDPGVTLNVVVTSNDPRLIASPETAYGLNADQVALTPPVFLTSNSQPLAPGASIQISVGGGGSPRTAINGGAPTQSSSSATSFPLD